MHKLYSYCKTTFILYNSVVITERILNKKCLLSLNTHTHFFIYLSTHKQMDVLTQNYLQPLNKTGIDLQKNYVIRYSIYYFNQYSRLQFYCNCETFFQIFRPQLWRSSSDLMSLVSCAAHNLSLIRTCVFMDILRPELA